MPDVLKAFSKWYEAEKTAHEMGVKLSSEMKKFGQVHADCPPGGYFTTASQLIWDMETERSNMVIYKNVITLQS